MKLHDTLLGLIFMALGGAMIALSFSFPAPRHLDFGPGVFPRLMGAGLALAGLGIALHGLWTRGPLVRLPEWLSSGRLTWNVAAIPLACLFYYLLSDALGYTLTALILLTILLVIGGVGVLRAALVALAVAVVTTVLFASILKVPLPWGVLAPVSGWLIW